MINESKRSEEMMQMLQKMMLIAAAMMAMGVQAQTYPTRPVKLVVGFEPGGNTDTVARLVAQKLSERLGQQVIVENKVGAAGTIGTHDVARAAPDGYTLTMGTTTTHAIAPAAYGKLPYDPVADFEPIAMVAIAPYMLVVNASFPAKDLKEFVAAVKAQPGKFNYGSAGQATTTHLVMATLADRAGLDMVHIPFKGNAPATTAILGGQVADDRRVRLSGLRHGAVARILRAQGDAGHDREAPRDRAVAGRAVPGAKEHARETGPRAQCGGDRGARRDAQVRDRHLQGGIQGGEDPDAVSSRETRRTNPAEWAPSSQRATTTA